MTSTPKAVVLAARQCPVCGQRNALEPFNNASMQARVGGLEMTVAGLTGEKCGTCHEEFLDDASTAKYAASLETLVLARREAEGQELRRVRVKLGLTQRDAGILAGGGPNGMSRWENGKVEPPKPVRALFGLLDRHPHLVHEAEAFATHLREAAEVVVANTSKKKGAARLYLHRGQKGNAKTAAGSALTQTHPGVIEAEKKKRKDGGHKGGKSLPRAAR